MEIFRKYIRPITIYTEIMMLFFTIGYYFEHNIINDSSDSLSSSNSVIASNSEFNQKSSEQSPSTSSEDLPKRIAITFDDGPNPITTTKLIEGLKQRKVKATFFIIGELAEQNPELIKKIKDEGHLIGNHTYSHKNLSCLNQSQAMNEIIRTNDILQSITHTQVKYIRPPYGLYNKKTLNKCNMSVILWSIDPRDWSILNADTVADYVISNAKDGDIILLHDIFDSSVEAAFKIIETLQKRGFVFVTVDKL